MKLDYPQPDAIAPLSTTFIEESNSPDEVIGYIKRRNVDIVVILDALVRANTALSMFVLIKIYCTNSIYFGEVYSWYLQGKLFSQHRIKYDKFDFIHPRLSLAKQTKLLHFRKNPPLNVETMSYDEFLVVFDKCFNRYKNRMARSTKPSTNKKTNTTYYPPRIKKTLADDKGMALDKFEFGLVD